MEESLTVNVRGSGGQQLFVPTHLSPNGGQTTHPSVVYVPRGGWNGYRYWMAHTPYPSGNDDHEDPNIVASNDGITWVTPYGLTNPIDDASGQPAYNSDVELCLGPDGLMHLIWRHYDSNAVGREETMFISQSQDGVTWSPKRVFYQTSQSTRRLVSPAVVIEYGRWVMWAVDILTTPNRMVRLESRSLDPRDGWTVPTVCTVSPMQAGKDPWHLSVLKTGDGYVGLLTDCDTGVSGVNGDILFIASQDGRTWKTSGRSIIPRLVPGAHDGLYRATMVPAIEGGLIGYRVWYSAWIRAANGKPSVWNVFRTWVGAAPLSASGTFHHGTGIATGSTARVAVSFPPGRFSAPPRVHLNTDMTRVNLGRTLVTAAGFTAILTNWSPATAGNFTVEWDACEG